MSPVRSLRYVVCIANKGYRASLVVRRIYQALPDRFAEKRGLWRVIDETCEDYLYPKRLFAPISFSRSVSKRLASAA